MAYDKLVDSAALDKQMTEIADAVKTKTIWTLQNNKVTSSLDTEGIYKIPFDEIAWNIRNIDRLSRMTLYPEGLDNGYYGVMAARCAATYRAAVALGYDTFDYNDDTNVFNTAINSEIPGKYSAAVRDSNGRGVLDCSSYIGLVLRGISYPDSPFVTHKNPGERWIPSEEMKYGSGGWEFSVIDKQPENEYRKTGFDGFSSIRGARHQAEFFYKYGYVVYDRNRDGLPTEDLKDRVKPGDLIFWSYIGDNGEYDKENTTKTANNFRSIHHVGMVSERTDYYLQVTGDTDNTENEETVKFSSFLNSVLNDISMICRPDYRRNQPLEIPKGVNILGYPWLISTNYTTQGVTLTTVGEQAESFKVTGKLLNSGIGVRLKGDHDNVYNSLHLTPGRYSMSLGNSAMTDDGVKLQLRRYIDGELTTVAMCAGSETAIFDLPEADNVNVRFTCTSTNQLDYVITPTLERIG